VVLVVTAFFSVDFVAMFVAEAVVILNLHMAVHLWACEVLMLIFVPSVSPLEVGLRAVEGMVDGMLMEVL